MSLKHYTLSSAPHLIKGSLFATSAFGTLMQIPLLWFVKGNVNSG